MYSVLERSLSITQNVTVDMKDRQKAAAADLGFKYTEIITKITNEFRNSMHS